jgi:selenophosphate synthetase-related protein
MKLLPITLDQITAQFRTSRNVIQKRELEPLLARINKEGYKTSQIFASIGEDAAAIRPSDTSDQLILLTTDSILSNFIQTNPYAAGFSVVYVGIEDIVACGGMPLGISVTMEYSDPKMGQQMLSGILDGTNRFQIPLIRGHTVTDSPIISLTSTVIGKNSISAFISTKSIKSGDHLGIVLDLEGEPGKLNHLYWNTILNSDFDRFYRKRDWISHCKHDDLLHACKDISNGGILGTLYQMVSYRGFGVNIQLDIIENHPIIQNRIYSLLEFLNAYLTSSFLIAFPPKALSSIQQRITDCGMYFQDCGEFIPEKQINLLFHGERQHLL